MLPVDFAWSGDDEGDDDNDGDNDDEPNISKHLPVQIITFLT